MKFVFNPFTGNLDEVGSSAAGTGILTVTGDSGGTVGADALDNINLVGGTGITVTGTAGTNTQSVAFSGAATGSGSTIGALSDDLITYDLGGTALTALFTVRIAARENAGHNGSGYILEGAVKTNGIAATIIAASTASEYEDTALLGASVDAVASGNNLVIRVTGVAALTMTWNSFIQVTLTV